MSWYFSFHVWLASLSMTLCRPIHFTANSINRLASYKISFESESISHSSCLTLWDPMDCSPPASSVHEILQARILEWVASSFSSDKVWSEWSKVARLCLTLCDPMGCSLPGSSVHGISQARVLEWVTISFSNWVTELNLNYMSVYM